MQCLNCKQVIPPGSRRCPFCGQPAQAVRRGRIFLILALAAIALAFFAGGLALGLAFLRRPQPPAPPLVAAATATPRSVEDQAPTATAAGAASPTSEATATAADTAATPATAEPATAGPAPTRVVVMPPTPTPAGPSSPAPSCTTPVSPDLLTLWQGDYAYLGCPTGPAADIWSAWQEYERGAMLWRSDTKQITILFADGRVQTVADTWDGTTVYNDVAPEGLMAPERGFAWVWHNEPGVQDSLGWATSDELGFCAQLQAFEQGYAFVSTGRPCSSELNRAREPGFNPLSIVVLNSGSWVRH